VTGNQCTEANEHNQTKYILGHGSPPTVQTNCSNLTNVFGGQVNALGFVDRSIGIRKPLPRPSWMLMLSVDLKGHRNDSLMPNSYRSMNKYYRAIVSIQGVCSDVVIRTNSEAVQQRNANLELTASSK